MTATATGQARPESLLTNARGEEQSDDPEAVPSVGFEEFQHARVAGSQLARERPPHRVVNVRVANRNRVGVGGAHREGHCRRPWADALELGKQCAGVLEGSIIESVELPPVQGCFADETSTLGVDVGRRDDRCR